MRLKERRADYSDRQVKKIPEEPSNTHCVCGDSGGESHITAGKTTIHQRSWECPTPALNWDIAISMGGKAPPAQQRAGTWPPNSWLSNFREWSLRQTSQVKESQHGKKNAQQVKQLPSLKDTAGHLQALTELISILECDPCAICLSSGMMYNFFF